MSQVTLSELPAYWKTRKHDKVLTFYRQYGTLGCLSNFYKHKPHRFELPECVNQTGGIDTLRAAGVCTTAIVSFSEKSLMLCKACLFKDVQSFREILTRKTPFQCKQIGRQVLGFEFKIWESVILEVAESILYQKFSSDQKLCNKLLATGDAVLAESSGRDKLWGTGLDIDDPDATDVSKWTGLNVLGYSLMRVRETLRNESSLFFKAK